LADVPDEDSPELTVAEFSELRPLSDVLPKLSIGKQRATIMLDEAVVRAYKDKAGGKVDPRPSLMTHCVVPWRPGREKEALR